MVQVGHRAALPANASRFLTIDIGGSGLKASVVNRSGEMLEARVRVKTPHPCLPDVLVDHLVALVAPLAPFDCVAVGFPGVVRAGIVVTAPNLGTKALRDLPLAAILAERLGRPVRMANDAEVQGLAAIEGRGVEMMVTLGTGFGTALFEDGRSLPNLELAHHPFHKGKTYEQRLGTRALAKAGKKAWNRRLRRAVHTLRRLVCFDRLYIGGGNAKHVRGRLDPDVEIVSNALGVKGGVGLWLGPAPPDAASERPARHRRPHAASS
jgi:polyphosphate glucokinase